MGKIIRVTLIFSLTFLSSCVTRLTGVQECALIGEVYQGSSIGSRTHIGSIGNTIYSYNTRVANPICRIPETLEEQQIVDETRPQARAIREKNNRNLILGYTGILVGSVVLALLIVAGIER